MKRLLVLALAVGALVAVAVAGAATSPLAGVYQATFRGQPAPLNGTWLITFTPAGAYTVTKKPSTARLIGGTATVSGHKIVFHDQTGQLACTGATARGAYSWTLTGKKLKLKVVKDGCDGRPLILAGATFTKIH